MVRIHFLALLLSTITLVPSCRSGNENSQTTAGNESAYGLSDSLADPLAGFLYQNLSRLSDEFILVGHQDALAYGIGWKGKKFRSDINDVCGDFPAVFGWDLGHIGRPENLDGVSFERMKQWMIEVYNGGGINTVSWHMRNIVSGGSSWDTSSCVSGILPGGEFHHAFVEKLNLVSDLFSSLKTDKGDLIPVVFRPFHEMNGGWFWWGSASCTPEEYKALYQFTVNYIRKEKQLHNIIYVYSTDEFFSEEEYLRYYPGDNYVDVLGFDDYKGLNKKENTHRTVAMLEILNCLGTERSKLITISETGLETIPDETWFTNVVLPTLKTNAATMKASWILFWRNGRPDHYYAPYPGHPSAGDFVKFKEDSFTLFLSGIQGLYKSDYNADIP